MSFQLPGSKSQATKTATAMRAIAADLRNAALGFDTAANEYQMTDPKVAKEAIASAFQIANDSFNLARQALSLWARST